MGEGKTQEVTLALAPRFPLLSLSICTESLRVANRELGRSAFSWTIVSVDGKPAVSSSGLEMKADAAFDDIQSTPISILLTSYGPEEAVTPELLRWLRRQDRSGAFIACVDTAGFVLAKAGILRGRAIAVHHETLPAYREVLRHHVILDRNHALDGRIASSVGGMATMDMMLALIERFHGRALADRVAYTLTYRRMDEGIAANVAGGPDSLVARVDRRLGKMVELMHAHMEDPLSVAHLCRLAHLDASTARRLFLRHFGETPGRAYMRFRMERARRLLVNSALQVSEIAAMSGFSDASAFTRAYRRHYGVAPSRARHDVSGDAATLPGASDCR